jgi:hypothetical protein
MPTSHVADSGGNTFGTTLDILIRPDVSDDARCNEFLRKVAESIVVAFPQSSQRAIEDSIVAAIAAADGRFADLNLNRVSTDAGNTAENGSDGGIFVGRRFASATGSAGAGVAGSINLPIPFGDTNYIASVEPSGDPGAFRWWIISKTNNQLTVGFLAANAVSISLYAKG